MKLWRPVGTALASLLLALPAAARHGYVTISPAIEQQRQLQSDGNVSPGIARLILAQRLGLSDYHSLDPADLDALDLLNTFSDGQQETLFESAGPERREQRKVLLLLEDVEDPSSLAAKVSKTRSSSGFRVENPPTSEHNARLMKHLAMQSNHSSRHDDASLLCSGPPLDLPANLKNEKISHAGCHTFLHAKLDKPNAGSITTSNIHQILTGLHTAAAASSIEVITVFLPPTPSTSFFKRSASPSSWGPYILPREVDDLSSTSSNTMGSGAPKRPLIDDEGPIKDKPGKGAEDDEDDEDDPDVPSSPSRPTKTPTSSSTAKPTDTSPPRGILAQCYTSESECDHATHSCSGHGSCELVFDISHSSSVSTKTKCYSCRCKAEASGEGGKKKTTRWTGPACQKKDVSTEFWLIGGVTVGLIGIIGWAIGLLSSMGAQELPSVIGAGVTGLGGRGK